MVALRWPCEPSTEPFSLAFRSALQDPPASISPYPREVRGPRFVEDANSGLFRSDIEPGVNTTGSRREAYPVESGSPTCRVLSGGNRAATRTLFVDSHRHSALLSIIYPGRRISGPSSRERWTLPIRRLLIPQSSAPLLERSFRNQLTVNTLCPFELRGIRQLLRPRDEHLRR